MTNEQARIQLLEDDVVHLRKAQYRTDLDLLDTRTKLTKELKVQQLQLTILIGWVIGQIIVSVWSALSR